MKFCKKCEKSAPTVIVGDIEECMICGATIEGGEEKSDSFANRTMAKNLKDIKQLTQKNPNTGQYTNAQNVGKNIGIGILIILAGILYAIGGIPMVFWGAVTIVVGLIVASIFIYILAMKD